MDLIKKERLIARQFIGKTPWFMIVWWAINLSVWFSLWPLTLTGLIPLYLTFLISLICTLLSYLPSHEAQHENIARKGSSLFWFNELIGYTSLIPLAVPYRLLRATHMHHHSYTNHPIKDPDYATKAKNFKNAVWVNFFINTSTNNLYKNFVENMEDNKENKRTIFESILTNISYWTILVIFVWLGYGFEVACLWWIPKLIATGYVRMTLSWAPHHPMKEQGRYRDTRGFKARIGTVLTMGMEYHIIHHLHPSIPLNLNPAAYRALKPILIERNCRLDRDL